MADHPEYDFSFIDFLQVMAIIEMELAFHYFLEGLSQPRRAQDRHEYARRFFGRRDSGQSQPDLASDPGPATAGNGTQANQTMDSSVGNLPVLVKTLNELCLRERLEPAEKRRTPLSLLQVMVETFFLSGPDPASLLFSNIQLAVAAKSYEITPSSHVRIDMTHHSLRGGPVDVKRYPWNSCKMATELVLILAAHATPACLHEALTSQSQSPGSLPTRESLMTSVPDSLSAGFEQARRAALEGGKTTVMGVKLTDRHIFDLAAQGVSDRYFTFAHSFAVGVGPEGFVVWQAWGKHGYRLDEYVRDGHARVRSWDEGRRFVDDFEKLAQCKVSGLSPPQPYFFPFSFLSFPFLSFFVVVVVVVHIYICAYC